MKTMRIGSLAAMAACALFCLASPAFANEATVTINFTGVANTSVQTLGAYAGYYSGNVNGGATTNFICDDYNDEIFVPESWQASATSFASLATSTAALDGTDFGKTIGVDGYAAIAYLSSLMATTPASGQADISAAIWYIGALGTGTNAGPLGNDSIPWSSLDATAQGYVTSLLGTTGAYGSLGGDTSNATSELEGSNLWVYTPVQGTQSAGDPTPQEFVGSVAVTTPEPGILTQLGLSLGLLGGLLLARKQLA